MLTVSQVRTLLPRGPVTTSIDLTDAYYHVPIARHFRSFLGFKLSKRAYTFKVMPFRLNIAPRIFKKLLETVVQELRTQGIQLVAYLDDWLIWATDKVIKFLEHIGFQINFKKSCLVPASCFQWLDLQWDLTTHKLSIPPKKRKEIAKNTKSFLKEKLTSRRNQGSILGSLQFAFVTDTLLKAKLKDIHRVWRSKANSKHRDKISRIPSILRKRLQPWTKVKNLAKSVPHQFPLLALVIHTDASLSGWGCYSQFEKVQGLWSVTFCQLHINIQEAMAVLLTLKWLTPSKKQHIRLILDSTVIVHCINRGGSKSSHINHVMIVGTYHPFTWRA
ncbi:uncharacterized protein [Palaemon carinicauda]|uniref:uncharacterized protein n=1 Tax=Palaemon carinicauda TaxID=392227 RepID=UPI0035B666D2